MIKILQIIKIIKIMAKFLLLSFLVLVLGIYSGCSSDGTGGAEQAGGGAAAPPPLLAIVYVDDDASDGGDGTSWTKAFKDLQAGINDAASKVSGNGYVRVHVAVGTYKPQGHPNSASSETTDRKKHFALKNGVSVIGGYSGEGDTKVEDPSKTILSGDIDTEGDDSDNAYHVFYHAGSTILDNSAKLSNVTITKGNANGTGQDDKGGGMYNDNSSPTLANVIFKYNTARHGGGMYNYGSSPHLDHVALTKNEADAGGGMYNFWSTPKLYNLVSFTANKAGEKGGGMYNKRGVAYLASCEFKKNIAGSIEKEKEGKGGAIYNIIKDNIWGTPTHGTDADENKKVINRGDKYVYVKSDLEKE